MIISSSTITIRCAPHMATDLVVDLHRYALVDRKIKRIKYARRDGDNVEIRHAGKIGVLLAPTMTYSGTVIDGVSIELRERPGFWSRFVSFVGRFDISDNGDGTCEVTHSESFAFHGVARPVETLIRSWLQRDIEAEMLRVRDLLEAGAVT